MASRGRPLHIALWTSLIVNALLVAGVLAMVTSSAASNSIAPRLHLATRDQVAQFEGDVDELKVAIADTGGVDDLSSRVDDLEYRLDDLETGTGDDAAASVDDVAFRLDDVESRVDDVESRVDAICGEFSFYAGALEDIYFSAC